MDDINFNVDRDAYYADALCDGALTLNQSTAHMMLSRSPKHAWAAHPQLGGRRRKTTPEMTLGTIIDEILLGGERGLEVVPFDAYRSNAAKEARDAAIARGKTPVKEPDILEYREASERARKNLDFAGIDLDEYQKQVCILWVEHASNGAPVQCRALMDLVYVARGLILDLKTTENARPDGLGRKCITYGYHIQGAAYTSALEHVVPDLSGRVRFQNVFLETEFPNVVTLTEPSGAMLQLGRVQWQRAVDIWEECTRTGKWPAYTAVGEVARLEPPPWAIDDAFEETNHAA